MAIAIVTDSTSDISPEGAKELGIPIVPLFVVFGDKSYRDGIDLQRAEFYEKLRTEKELPITSQPTAQMFEDAFRPLVEAGHDIFCPVISTTLSGTINAARAAAQRFPNAKIEIYDSETTSGGLGMMVRRAKQLIDAGAGWDELMRALEYERSTQHLYACFPDLSHLLRTGRIGKAQQVLGTLMKIVPVLSLERGVVEARAQVRTFSRAQEQMLDLTMNAVADRSKARFQVVHTNAKELAVSVRQRLIERLDGVTPLAIDIEEAGPVIAVHGGPGAVGIFVTQDE
jgi:DegV family protein with EDD domain